MENKIYGVYTLKYKNSKLPQSGNVMSLNHWENIKMYVLGKTNNDLIEYFALLDCEKNLQKVV